jgi:hypothetical protein
MKWPHDVSFVWKPASQFSGQFVMKIFHATNPPKDRAVCLAVIASKQFGIRKFQCGTTGSGTNKYKNGLSQPCRATNAAILIFGEINDLANRALNKRDFLSRENEFFRCLLRR